MSRGKVVAVEWKLVLVLVIGVCCLLGLTGDLLRRRNRMMLAHALLVNIAEDSVRSRRELGVWPSSLAALTNRAVAGSALPLDGLLDCDPWGEAIVYLQFDDKRGYGSVRSEGAKAEYSFNAEGVYNGGSRGQASKDDSAEKP